jgi:hypothetical protein
VIGLAFLCQGHQCGVCIIHRQIALPTMQSTMHLYPINGAAGRVGRHDTPWAYRNATWAAVMVGVDPDPANKDRITRWAKEYWEAVHRYSEPGAYVNFMMDEGEDRVKATYRDNYARLADQEDARSDQCVPGEPEY